MIVLPFFSELFSIDNCFICCALTVQPSKDDYKKKTESFGVFIGKIPADTERDQLESNFSKFGKIIKVNVFPGSEKKLPYAAVFFSSKKEMETCLAEKSHKVITVFCYL